MRQIYAGTICSECHTWLPERTDGRSGTRLCGKCGDKLLHTVHMNFMYRDGWHVTFLEDDLKTALLWRGRFASVDSIYRLIRKTYQPGNAERDFENAKTYWGQGTVKRRVNAEQYFRLKRSNPRHL